MLRSLLSDQAIIKILKRLVPRISGRQNKRDAYCVEGNGLTAVRRPLPIVTLLLTISFLLPSSRWLAAQELGTSGETGSPNGVQASLSAANPNDEAVRFFESKIRPALIEHCQDCHAAESEASGGLLLDSRDGWQAGGDSGKAIVAGKPLDSLVFKAITYDDPDLQMPPDGKLPAEVVSDFRTWIMHGAVDPRRGEAPKRSTTGLPVEQAQEHWSYRPVQRVDPPGGGHVIDAFVNEALEENGLVALGRASNQVLVRRIYFDLLGLPPTPQQIQAFAVDCRRLGDQAAVEQLVDRLLSSGHFGEHFARKWMDVARYAESVTLRGFVLPEAWRYRDYLIDAFNSDRPFDQMVREQLAGDLIPDSLPGDVSKQNDADRVRETQLRRIATAFLAMGNTNLERQDKTQLDMDYIDEQLEVIGRAFLGQTIGCARCHDHKFDPIPTRDYYALAGIMRSASAMEHSNVSKWIEEPLPLTAEEQAKWDERQQELKSLTSQIGEIKTQLASLAGAAKDSIALDSLAGVVVDGDDATYVGEWRESQYVKPFVGPDYRVLENGKGQGTATFEPNNLPPGEYDVRMSYTSGPSRASALTVKVFSADGEYATTVDQRKKPDEEHVWIRLGRFRFESQGQAYVLLSNEQTKGHMIADAVQFIPLEPSGTDDIAVSGTDATGSTNVDSEADAAKIAKAQELSRLAAELKTLEQRQSDLKKQLASRPKYLTVRENSNGEDIPIHIRGDVHNLGEVVPRGFLTAVEPRVTEFESSTPMRLQFANWVADDQNPLTSRVFANRVWLWLMGRGLVSTPNNFGTTGAEPSHTQLLDWLASELVENGWSTKHLVRVIVTSQAYQRASVPFEDRVDAPEVSLANEVDPNNQFYWRGHRRRLSVEALRDAMLSVSGELDTAFGGSLIRGKVNADYNYVHSTTRRSVYHPVFRNSLPELYEAFDFADASVSVGQRPRSTVATQALVLMNHPWVSARAKAYALRLESEYGVLETWNPDRLQELVSTVYFQTIGRNPTAEERAIVEAFLNAAEASEESRQERLVQFVHSLFASLDFRYLD